MEFEGPHAILDERDQQLFGVAETVVPINELDIFDAQQNVAAMTHEVNELQMAADDGLPASEIGRLQAAKYELVRSRVLLHSVTDVVLAHRVAGVMPQDIITASDS